MSTRTVIAAAAVVPLALGPFLMGLGTSANAADRSGGGVRAGGACSGGGARWTLKAKHDDGRIEVEGEVDSDRSGQVWHWTLRHNASVSASGRSATGGVSSTFEVRRRMADLSGTDHVVFRATHGAQTCRGTVAV